MVLWFLNKNFHSKNFLGKIFINLLSPWQDPLCYIALI
jgi:hypothetical protein